MTPPLRPTSPRPAPAPLGGLPPAIWQRIIDHAHPHDALSLGCTAPAFRTMSARHPVLRAPLTWADAALCVTPRVAARKLADMPDGRRQAFLQQPYFATRPDEHQLAYYGALYPYSSLPPVQLAQASERPRSERIDWLVEQRQHVERRIDAARGADQEIKRRLLPKLSREDRRSVLLSPPSLPYSTSTLARMGSLLAKAGAALRAEVQFFAGLIEPIDGLLFRADDGIDEDGQGRCCVATLLRDLHQGDPVRHILDVLTQASFEKEPLLVRRVWHRIAGEPQWVHFALRRGLDPTTSGTDKSETLPGALLQLEVEEEARQEEACAAGMADEGVRVWPLRYLMSWHVLQLHGFYLDTPMASDSQDLMTYREMLESLYPQLGSWLLEPLERTPRSIGALGIALNDRLFAHRDDDGS